ncbi:MAG: VanZ family protein [Planctomycetes bacterium]|nr:VanZ family protein [Planctomycetota bacterium]
MKAARRWLLVVLFAGAIFTVSGSRRPLGIESPIPGVDKVAHFAVYFFFTVTVYRALTASGAAGIRAALAAVAIAAAYGATDEIHQAFVPGRCASVADWLADAAGASLLAVIVRRAARKATSPPGRQPPGP